MYQGSLPDRPNMKAPARIRSYCTHFDHFPLTPTVASALSEILLDPEAQDDFVELLNCDPMLLANLLRRSRLPFSDQALHPERMNPAADPLLKALLLAWTLETSYLQGEQQLTLTHFSRHSLRTAIISREIALQAAPGLETDAYRAGLLHDIGKPLLLLLDWSEVTRLYKGTLQSGGALYQSELLSWDYSHAHTGQWILESWQLPAVICLAVGGHHQPGLLTADDEDAIRLGYILHLADHLDQRPAGLIHEAVTEPLDDRLWDLIDLNPSALPQLLERAEEQITATFSRCEELWYLEQQNSAGRQK